MTATPAPEERWHRSLSVRMLGLMSLALLPVGMIAVWQTWSVTDASRQNAELALRVLTEQAAQEERLILQRAFGSAHALAATLPGVDQAAPECSARMAQFVEASPHYSFAGFLPSTGRMTCSSAQRYVDFSEYPGFRTAMDNPAPQVQSNPRAPLSGGPVVVVNQPVFDPRDNELLGYVSLSIPHDAVLNGTGDQRNVGNDPALIDLITFNAEGQVLIARGGVDRANALLPAGVELTELAGRDAHAFSDRDGAGTDRIYALAPVEAGRLYVLGIWDVQSGLTGQVGAGLATSLFPAIMWLVSLSVALFSIHQLVTRHIRVLGRQMAAFADRRTVPALPQTDDMPTELRRIHDVFLRMTQAIVHDEAKLEDAVREKNVLLKEIHHRVKNNLQLISSIINMKIRQVSSPEAKRALRRIQDRVLSLATIHRDLYQTNAAGLINVGQLVQEVVGSTIEIAAGEKSDVRLETRIEDVWLYPDQAVPMSLLAAEAATNAVKYAGRAGPEHDPWICVSFAAGEGAERVFELANSLGEPDPNDDMESTGMGSKLIGAFAVQLGARVEIAQEDGAYRLRVHFDAQDFAPEPGQY